MSFYALIDEHHLPNHRRLLQYLLVNLRCGVFCERPVSFCSISQTCVISQNWPELLIFFYCLTWFVYCQFICLCHFSDNSSSFTVCSENSLLVSTGNCWNKTFAVTGLHGSVWIWLCICSCWSESWIPTRESRRLLAQHLQLLRKKPVLNLCRTSVLFSKPSSLLLANTRYDRTYFIHFLSVSCRYCMWIQAQLKHTLEAFHMCYRNLMSAVCHGECSVFSLL